MYLQQQNLALPKLGKSTFHHDKKKEKKFGMSFEKRYPKKKKTKWKNYRVEIIFTIGN